mmetsp:Transcript_36108/g.31871  ORF Transcript_36108/g.31871 Transcript_36108/m.31871 type:complete len:163 (-) Transcript_36108:212-700(-)|eukprot:CAMPEP_0201579892 /NCGR_PEP_ID=MMETSP0190_2-20130828/27789_1 /ASSEMBLY_ACC=CAM_ASM_000263 /TAXON_ID=37353 /ORGANISM="Rosalina sp." /LENGTH=162 /DNA_ID=CAMNT_0048014983 /DNA_START=30 /DNA_END=518 /DNA_ORIENTATION=-
MANLVLTIVALIIILATEISESAHPANNNSDVSTANVPVSTTFFHFTTADAMKETSNSQHHNEFGDNSKQMVYILIGVGILGTIIMAIAIYSMRLDTKPEIKHKKHHHDKKEKHDELPNIIFSNIMDRPSIDYGDIGDKSDTEMDENDLNGIVFPGLYIDNQ